MKAHILVSDNPLSTGADHKSLCGVIVQKAEFAFIWDTDSLGLSVDWKDVCPHCAGQPLTGRYVYGAFDGQAYHDAQIKIAQRKLERRRQRAQELA